MKGISYSSWWGLIVDREYRTYIYLWVRRWGLKIATWESFTRPRSGRMRHPVGTIWARYLSTGLVTLLQWAPDYSGPPQEGLCKCSTCHQARRFFYRQFNSGTPILDLIDTGASDV